MLLPERLYQNCQANLVALSINGLRERKGGFGQGIRGTVARAGMFVVKGF